MVRLALGLKCPKLSPSLFLQQICMRKNLFMDMYLIDYSLFGSVARVGWFAKIGSYQEFNIL